VVLELAQLQLLDDPWRRLPSLVQGQYDPNWDSCWSVHATHLLMRLWVLGR